MHSSDVFLEKCANPRCDQWPAHFSCTVFQFLGSDWSGEEMCKPIVTFKGRVDLYFLSGFQLYGGAIITVLSSKTSQRYRLQSGTNIKY